MFANRAILAATLSPAWGVYGPAFELMEHTPARAGSEEYLDSEKYQVRQWDLHEGRQPLAAARPAQPDPSRAAGAGPPAHAAVPQHRQPRPAVLLEDRPGRRRPADPGGRQPRRASTASRLRRRRPRPARACPYESSYDVVDQLGEASYRWHGADELRRARPRHPCPSAHARALHACRDRGRDPVSDRFGPRHARGFSRASAGATQAGHMSRRPTTSRGQRRPAPSVDAGTDWYRDAIIYELHVRAFADSNGDGIGDFNGLTSAARLPRRPRRHRHLAAAVLPVALARRRLRHRRLPHGPPRLRRPAPVQAASSRPPTTATSG